MSEANGIVLPPEAPDTGPAPSRYQYTFHWCRKEGWTEGTWWPAAVVTLDDGRRCIFAGWLGHALHYESEKDIEIGPRLPTPERLEALERLADVDPQELGRLNGERVCHYCGSGQFHNGALCHKADCIHQLAQETKS